MRRVVALEAKIVLDGNNYPGFIKNISEHGLHLLSASGKKLESDMLWNIHFAPGMTLKIERQTAALKKTDLRCIVRWVHINKDLAQGLTYRMGLDILNQ